jgi:hypothetical protein
LVYLVCLVERNLPDELNQPDKQNKPEQLEPVGEGDVTV